ncbi:MAG: hypothetical protein IJD92_02595 [Bacilli bacterium]|nr:hypothetical protein [Bacilli bacterium]
MFFIDDIEFRLIMPEIFLSRLNVYGIDKSYFNILNDNYILKENVSEEIKYTLLSEGLSFLTGDMSETVLNNDEVINKYGQVGAHIYYKEHLAKSLYTNNKIDKANNILKKLISELCSIREEVYSNDRKY